MTTEATKNRRSTSELFEAGLGGDQGPVGGFQKRVLDIIVAALALILLLPLLVIIAVLVLVTMGRPVFFTHERISFSGKRFNCYKFRTMVKDSDSVLLRHLETNNEAAAEWRHTQKLRNDPRTTRLGQILRKLSIDELPQLLNVLRGEMSCVGPRPVMEEELSRYGSGAAQYLMARPGITGPWQVSGRNGLSYEERVALDVEYVQDWSMMRDIQLLIKTIPAVFRINETT